MTTFYYKRDYCDRTTLIKAVNYIYICDVYDMGRMLQGLETIF